MGSAWGFHIASYPNRPESYGKYIIVRLSGAFDSYTILSSDQLDSGFELETGGIIPNCNNACRTIAGHPHKSSHPNGLAISAWRPEEGTTYEGRVHVFGIPWQ